MKLLHISRQFWIPWISVLMLSQSVWSQQNASLCHSEGETLSTLFMDYKMDGAQWSKTLPLRTMKLSFYPERNSLPGVGNRADVDVPYVLAADTTAPLVFIQSGLGGTGYSAYNFYLMGILHAAGYSVVSIPSQYYWRMSLATSFSMRPGYKNADLAHLGQVYQFIRQKFEKQKMISPTAINYFVGISNGGYNGIQIAHKQLPEIHFEKFVVVNPPIDLAYGIQTLDQLFVDGRKRVSHQQYDQIFGKFTLVFTQPSATIEANLQRIQQAATPEDLRYVIARQLIESVQEAAAASQALGDQSVFKTSNLFTRLTEARRWSVQDYQNRILIPYFAQKNVTEKMITENTLMLKNLKAIAPQKKLLLLHSLNDFISRPTDILAAKKILGANAVIAQCGGHVGALPTPLFTTALLNFLK